MRNKNKYHKHVSRGLRKPKHTTITPRCPITDMLICPGCGEYLIIDVQTEQLATQDSTHVRSLYVYSYLAASQVNISKTV